MNAMRHAAPPAPGSEPCWITEWGVPNRDVACRSNEAQRLPVVRDTRAAFRELARQRRLIAAISYSWGTTGAEKQDRFGTYRCAAPTPNGQEALRR